MITAALAIQMDAQGVAGLKINDSLFWEEMPVASDGKPGQGVWLMTRGGMAANSPKGINLSETIDIYVMMANKFATEAAHQRILEWLNSTRYFCELSGTVGGVAFEYHNIRLRPTTTPQNYALTHNGMVVKVASVEVFYDIN